MSLTKTSAAITQLTGSGNSTTLNVTPSYYHTLYLSHYNGTGSVTGSATAKVQIQPASAIRWYDLTTVTFSLTTSATDTQPVDIPIDATGVRIVYTAPTGPTGFTLDAEVGEESGI